MDQRVFWSREDAERAARDPNRKIITVCGRCGWEGERRMKNAEKPCPKCGMEFKQ